MHLNSIMNKYISVVSRVFYPQSRTMLGRWGVEYREEIIQRKVYWANEDHCGPCGIELKPKKEGDVESTGTFSKTEIKVVL
jgi:hypothetical protein